MEKNNMESGKGDTGASSIRRYGHFWAAYDDAGQLVCVTVYKKGAAEVVRRLQGIRNEKPTALNPCLWKTPDLTYLQNDFAEELQKEGLKSLK